jgi:hypothetical protein
MLLIPRGVALIIGWSLLIPLAICWYDTRLHVTEATRLDKAMNRPRPITGSLRDMALIWHVVNLGKVVIPSASFGRWNSRLRFLRR